METGFGLASYAPTLKLAVNLQPRSPQMSNLISKPEALIPAPRTQDPGLPRPLSLTRLIHCGNLAVYGPSPLFPDVPEQLRS